MRFFNVHPKGPKDFFKIAFFLALQANRHKQKFGAVSGPREGDYLTFSFGTHFAKCGIRSIVLHLVGCKS